MTTAPARPSGLQWLYTNNPFYVISAVLMLFAVRTAYGNLEIGSINCWIMLAVLAGYTILLSGITVAIVRWGRVWDDARSLFVLAPLLLLGVSISADDLIVQNESHRAAAGLVIGGCLGAILLSEAVLRFSRIRLSWLYRIPYHLLLVLFYSASYVYSPALHHRDLVRLEWLVLLFPLAGAAIFLLLIPAVRRGFAATSNSGTPWSWPWFPWTLFGVMAGAVGLRTFVLSLTFTAHGPTWLNYTWTLQDINFNSMFGLYFLVPLAFAILCLILEGAIVTGNTRLQQRLLFWAPLLLVLAYPYRGSGVYQEFLNRFTETCGSPLWITVWLLLVFYSRACLARVPMSGVAWGAAVLLLTYINMDTTAFLPELPSAGIKGPVPEAPIATAPQPLPWPAILIAALALLQGFRRRSAPLCVLGSLLGTYGLSLVLPNQVSDAYRMTISYHALWAMFILLGLIFRNRATTWLRIAGAAPIPIVTTLALIGIHEGTLSLPLGASYIAAVAVIAVIIATTLRDIPWFVAFALQLLALMSNAAMLGYQGAVAQLGRPATATMLISFGTLLIGLLISARKANWISAGPPRMNPPLNRSNLGDEFNGELQPLE